MEGSQEFQPLLAYCSFHFRHDVTAGTQAYGVPAIDLAIPHSEAVSMFGHRPDISGARLLEESDPGVSTEVLSSKGGGKVLITEAIERSVGGNMVLVFRPARQIHPVGVPLACKGGHGIKTPM